MQAARFCSSEARVAGEWRCVERFRQAELIGTEATDGLCPSDHYGVLAHLALLKF